MDTSSRSLYAARTMVAFVCVVLCVLAVVTQAHSESKHAVATRDHSVAATTTTTAPPTDAEDHGPFVRCRMCGAKIASMKDHMVLHDTSKAVSARHSSDVGEHGGHIHTFVNPSRVEMELVAFKKAIGVDSETFTSKATFFDGYNWRDFRCNSCNRHVGWTFHHDDLESCIQTSMMESVAAKAEEELKSMTSSELTRKKELVRKEMEGQCVTATAGWWSYEICYKKEVRQYHEEADGARPSDWSMGVFVSDDKLPGDQTPIMGTEVVQYFAGGQHCDENGELRNTKVVYTCCKSKPTIPTVDNVEEPSLCSYVITVCVPSLCTKPSKSESAREYQKLADQCEAKFGETHTAVPASFTALRWATVISEESSELDWAREMQLKT